MKIARRFVSAFVITISVILLFGCRDISREHGPVEVRVNYVIDGDTVILARGERLRYIGMDTPERMRREGGEWVYDPEPYAEEAKAMNMHLTFGKTLFLEFDEERTDGYGRLLGYLFNEKGEMVNEQLLRQGMASVYTFPPNIAYRDRLVAAQIEAVSMRRGIWRELLETSPGLSGAEAGSALKVTGQIQRAIRTQGSLYLFFDPDDDHIVIRIPLSNLVFFSEMGIDPGTFYLDRTVTVIGLVEHKRYRQIYVDGPFQISLEGQNSDLIAADKNLSETF